MSEVTLFFKGAFLDAWQVKDEVKAKPERDGGTCCWVLGAKSGATRTSANRTWLIEVSNNSGSDTKVIIRVG